MITVTGTFKNKCEHCYVFSKGSSINDVTALRGIGFQGLYDNSIKALVLNGVTRWKKGVKYNSKKRDVI